MSHQNRWTCLRTMAIVTVLYHCIYFFFIYFYQLEANYFTVLQWFLSYIDMNQPRIYMCSPSHIIAFKFLCLSDNLQGFPGSTVVKNPSANAGNASSVPGSGRSPGEGDGNPPQYSCLEIPMDGGAWRAIVHGVAKKLETSQ